jgi:hypothetical protein
MDTTANEAQSATSITQRLSQHIRKSAAGRAVVPMEATTGLPVPYRHGGRIYAIFPYFVTAATDKKEEVAIFAPVLTLTVDWQTSRLVEFVDCRYRSQWEGVDYTRPIGTFPHPAVAGMTRDEYAARRQRLLRLYDDIFNAADTGTEPDEKVLSEFSQLFKVILEPSLQPFYRALAPRFCEQFLGPVS